MMLIGRFQNYDGHIKSTVGEIQKLCVVWLIRFKNVFLNCYYNSFISPQLYLFFCLFTIFFIASSFPNLRFYDIITF